MSNYLMHIFQGKIVPRGEHMTARGRDNVQGIGP